MPRQLLRDRQIVADDWRYAAEAADDASAPLIVEFEEFVKDRVAYLKRGVRLGVVLKPEQPVEEVVADLPQLALVAARFTGPGEGRGYTQGSLLRQRYAFQGELRAVGYVRPDQVFMLARCGFNSFEMTDADLQVALPKFGTYTRAYQPANDTGLPHALRRA